MFWIYLFNFLGGVVNVGFAAWDHDLSAALGWFASAMGWMILSGREAEDSL